MKTHVSTVYLFRVIIIGVLGLLFPWPAFTQSKPQVLTTTPASVADSSPQTYDLEIAHGVLLQPREPGKKLEATVGNVVDALRERYPDANIVLTPGLAKLEVSDLKLRAAHLDEELQAIEVASGDKFRHSHESAPGGADSGLVILRPQPGPGTTRVVEAFNLDPYLQWIAGKNSGNNQNKDQVSRYVLGDLQKMIENTIATLKQGESGGADQPTFQFHPGANVLVVIGTQESVNVARKLIKALPGEGFIETSAQASPDASDAESRAKAQEDFMRRYGLMTRGRNLSAEPPEKPTPASGQSR